LLGESGEWRAAPKLFDDAVGGPLGVVGLLDLVDRHEYLGHP